MMRHLHIRNYALIDHLEIDWNNGFTVITGETGSGKSILLGALGLILGNRADTAVLRNSQMKCVVEAVFDLSRFHLIPFFETNDLDYEELTTVRREIHHTGKSRAFINDTPVKLTQLKVLGNQLVDIHSQHETLNLKSNQFQLHLLDDFAGLSDDIKSFRENYRRWKNLVKQIDDCRESIRVENQSRDFHTFQLDEIEVLNLRAEEQETAEQELEILGSAEEIKASLHRASDSVGDGENNAESLLRSAMQAIEAIRSKSAEFEELHHRIKSAWIEVKDIGEEMSRIAGEIEFNPERASALQERLNDIYKLEQKHGVGTVEELLQIAEELQEKLNSGADREHELQQMEHAAAELRVSLGEQARHLSNKRKESAQQLEIRLNELLVNLEMKSAQFKVQIIDLEEPEENGMNRVEFELKANKGHDFLPLQNVASGGELSRVMLALKSVNSGKKAAPTLLLDEIDSGVSGKVATAMAELLSRMGSTHQLICITHLPQIAARGQSHFKVFKTESGETTQTHLESLDRDGRLTEIAGMLSGFDTTDAAIENARNLMHLN